MDLAAGHPYVAGAMELLLILSALLSAVTGALTSPFGPEARSPHQTSVEAISIADAAVDAVVIMKAPAALRPFDTQQAAPPPPQPTTSPVASTPIQTDRLLE